MNDQENIKQHGDACTLKEACAATIIHGEALLLLLILVGSFREILGELLGGFSGSLPAGTEFLVSINELVSHWLMVSLASFILLVADVQVYRWLFSKKGRVASAVWSLAVSTALTIAIISFGYLYLSSLSWVGSFKHAVP